MDDEESKGFSAMLGMTETGRAQDPPLRIGVGLRIFGMKSNSYEQDYARVKSYRLYPAV